MRKLVITITTLLILGGAIAAHSADTTEGPSWVRPDGTEIESQVPAWVPVVGASGQLVGYTRASDESEILTVFDSPGGSPVGTVGAEGFQRSTK